MTDRPSLLLFCLRSLPTEYGIAFLLRVLVRHPVQAIRGAWRFLRERGGGGAEADGDGDFGGSDRLVGAGFCLKPLDPPCVSGRANHDCRYFEQRWHAEGATPPPCCASCEIRELGLRALRAGCDFYVMTSARDILDDLLRPALEERRYSSAALTLCRYSFEPFRLALAICELPARMVPFASGDCRDFATWRRADVGDKDERTELAPEHRDDLRALLERTARDPAPAAFTRRGNLFVPEP